MPSSTFLAIAPVSTSSTAISLAAAVRLATPAERPRWDALMDARHHL